MKIRTTIKAGALTQNHNQAISRGPKVKSKVKAESMAQNHNQTIVRGVN